MNSTRCRDGSFGRELTRPPRLHRISLWLRVEWNQEKLLASLTPGHPGRALGPIHTSLREGQSLALLGRRTHTAE